MMEAKINSLVFLCEVCMVIHRYEYECIRGCLSLYVALR